MFVHTLLPSLARKRVRIYRIVYVYTFLPSLPLSLPPSLPACLPPCLPSALGVKYLACLHFLKGSIRASRTHIEISAPSEGEGGMDGGEEGRRVGR